MWWKGRLAQEAASVVMNWNRNTSSIVDGLVQRVVSVMVD